MNYRLYLRIGLLALLCWQADLFLGCVPFSAVHGYACAADRPSGRHFKVNKKTPQHAPKVAAPSATPRATSRHARRRAQAAPSRAGRHSVSRTPGVRTGGTTGRPHRQQHFKTLHSGTMAGKAAHSTRISHSAATVSTIQKHTEPLSHTTHTISEAAALDVQNDVHHLDDHTAITHQDDESVHPMIESHAPPHEKSLILVVNPDNDSLKTAKQQGLHVQIAIEFPHLGISVASLAVPAEGGAEQALENLQGKGISRAVLNTYYRLDAGTQPDKPLPSGTPTPLFNWSRGGRSCGMGVKVGMVDSRVDVQQPELSHQQIHCKDFVREDGSRVEADHGTAIAKQLVGFRPEHFTGLIPGATLFAAAAFSGNSSESPGATVLTILESLDWLVSQKIQVINLSFSGPDNALLSMAMDKILKMGIPVVAAAGNHGALGDPAYPGAYNGVIAVTAVDQFERPYRNANQGTYISFAAPGVRVPIPGMDGKMSYKTGTSFAAPYSTALLAMILSRKDKELTITQALAGLRRFAVDLGDPGKDPVFGWGLLHRDMTCDGQLYSSGTNN